MEFVYPIRDPETVGKITQLLRKHYSDVLADAWVIGCNSGLRVSDLINLTKSQVIGNSIRAKASKTGKVSNVEVGAKAEAILAKRKAMNPDSPYLFLSDSNRAKASGKPITRQSLSRALKDIGELLELEGGLSSHSMRKSYGYAVYKAEGLAEAQNALGHSSSGVTLDYLALGHEKANGAIKALDMG